MIRPLQSLMAGMFSLFPYLPFVFVELRPAFALFAFNRSSYLPNLLLFAIIPKDRENIFEQAILLFNIPLDIYCDILIQRYKFTNGSVTQTSQFSEINRLFFNDFKAFQRKALS